MAAAPVNLDQGPPLPQQLQPQPSVAQLAGQQGGGQGQQSGSASLQSQVIQKAMFCEQTMNDMATMMPSLTGPLGGLIDQFRKIVGGELSKGAIPPPSQGAAGTGLMVSPTGGTGNAPTS